MSAVSNSVMPRSIALWITLREASRSMRWPKLLQPRPTAETRRPEPPRLRISMDDPVLGYESPLYCDVMGLSRKTGQACRTVPEPQKCWKCRNKKVRPRSDAATDGDRWGGGRSSTGGLIKRM